MAIKTSQMESASSNQVPLQYERKCDMHDTYFEAINHEFKIF